MKLYVWRGERTNFGDELNTWLMPRVFPGLFDEPDQDGDDSTLFFGIGSTLFDIFPKASRKIVFGTGYAGYTPLPQFDETWRFYGVRGPRTAQACGLPPDMAIGDAAILMANYRTAPAAPASGAAFIPHYDSCDRGHWAQACRLAGVRFINPSSPVETVLEAIRGSRMLIAEAMHGAIVADALRTPWIPVMPIHPDHRMKWSDWAQALDIDLRPHTVAPSSLAEAWIGARGGGGASDRFVHTGGLLGAGVRVLDQGFVRWAAASLTRLAKAEPMLSTDAALARTVARLEEKAADIRRDFPARG